mgnify:CR=1 FL=1
METLSTGLPSPLDSLKATATPPRFSKDMTPEKIREQAEEFEAFFLSQVLNTMFKGIKTDGPFNGGHGEEMFRDMQMQEYGKVVAKTGGIGIADSIVRQLLETQEVKEGAVQ